MTPDSSHGDNILRECLELVQFNRELSLGGPRLKELQRELEHLLEKPWHGCLPESQMEFVCEINIHPPQPTSVGRTGVFLFPNLSVCPECGSAQFTIPAKELRVLHQRQLPKQLRICGPRSRRGQNKTECPEDDPSSVGW